MIVGGDGDPAKARQVVTCGSYETRDRGVRAGMPLRAAARKAPDAVFLPLDMDLYAEASAQVWDVVRSVGYPVEVAGFDEGYIGFGAREAPAPAQQEAERLAGQVRAAVLSATGLHCCVGISDNKQRAKIAAGFAKRAIRSPAAHDRSMSRRQFTLTDATWSSLMGARPADALWSVGARTAKRLAEHGVTTVAELAATPLDDLIALFGPHKGRWLYVLAAGGGDDSITRVAPPARSHSKSKTYPADLTDPAELHAAAHELLREVLDQVVGEGRLPVRVAMTVRTATFDTRTKLRKLPMPTAEYDQLAPIVDDLLDAFGSGRPIRLLSVRLELADLR